MASKMKTTPSTKSIHTEKEPPPAAINAAQNAADVLRSLAQGANKPMLCLQLRVRSKPVHSFLSLLPAEQTAWLPKNEQILHQSDWQLVGLGCAIELVGEGTSRFHTIKLNAAKQFGAISILSDAPKPHFPQLRFFGGGAFVPGRNDAIWSGFQDARFIIPRWQYATQSSDATLQLVIQTDEFHSSSSWQRELQTIFEWLYQKETLKMPATQSVNITHYSNGWESLVSDALKKINAGVLEKVVVSRMSHLVSNHPFSVQRFLETLESSFTDCTRFVLGGDNGIFVGATPEQLVRVNDHGYKITADALAGSAQRAAGGDKAALALQQNEKERREFEFVLSNIEAQFVKNDIRITSEREVKIKSLKNLYHLHCQVTGICDTPKHALDLVEQLHPTPAVCGTPTGPAAKWLIENEHQNRGWYAGPVGWFDAIGEGDVAVGIRSALLKNNEAWLFAGAGIVRGSSAAIEFTETGAKLTPMLSALGAV